MKKILKVLVVFGGTNSERYVSLNTAKECIQSIKELGHKVHGFDYKGNVYELINEIEGKALTYDVVFNALHGTFGEDGAIQGILDALNIPYTHSGRIASTYAMDKYYSKKIIDGENFNSKLVPSGKKITFEVSFPSIIKPRYGGSTLGVTLINSKEDLSKVNNISDEDRVIEPFIYGREFTVSVLQNKALTVTEIILPDNNIYDETTKYSVGRSSHICPALITKKESEYILNWSKEIHFAFGCKGISRSDFKLEQDKSFETGLHFLEINSQPGLTVQSLSPEQAEYCGIPFNKLISILLQDALS